MSLGKVLSYLKSTYHDYKFWPKIQTHFDVCYRNEHFAYINSERGWNQQRVQKNFQKHFTAPLAICPCVCLWTTPKWWDCTTCVLKFCSKIVKFCHVSLWINPFQAAAIFSNKKTSILVAVHLFCLVESGTDKPTHMSNWEWRVGAESTTETFPNMLNRIKGSIVVPREGTYVVYVHTTFVSNQNEGKNKTRYWIQRLN